MNCPGDNTVEVARCEACKQIVDHYQCFRQCRDLARISFIVKPTGHGHLCYNCWCSIACKKYGHLYGATYPIEPVNLFESVSTTSSGNNAALPSSTTNESRQTQGKDLSNSQANSLPRSCNDQPITHENADNFSDCDSELAKMDLTNINKGVKRSNPYTQKRETNFNEGNNEDRGVNHSSYQEHQYNPTKEKVWLVESLEEMWTCKSRHAQTCNLCDKMMPEGTFIERVTMTMEKSDGKIIHITRWVHYDCDDNGYHGTRRTRAERGMTKQIALHSPTNSMASNGGKSKPQEQGHDGCNGSELKQHQNMPQNITHGNFTNNTCDGSDLTTDTSAARPLNLTDVRSNRPTETITFSPSSSTITRNKRGSSKPPATTNDTTQMVTQHASTTKNKTQSNSRNDDHSLMGKQSIESSTNDYVQDDWLVSDNDDNGNYSSSCSGSDWVMAKRTEDETTAKRKKIDVDRYSPDSSDSVLDDDDYEEEDQYSDDDSENSEEN